MKKISWQARAYLGGSYIAGAVALAWLVSRDSGHPLSIGDWLLAALLAVVASVCQLFVVKRTSTTGERSDHLTPAPILAALVLLPSPLLALVLIITWLPEWFVHRRTWYPQLWNIAAYLLAGALASAGYTALVGGTSTVALTTYPIGILTLPVLFLGTQTLLLAWVLKLARGQSFQTSGLFEPGKLLTEVGTACVGLAFALVWQLHPAYGLLAGLPLLLIFQALHVPNLKEEAATDPKTGLANMRHFESEMARTLERAGRAGSPFSLLVADLDYLRNINNTYGHQAGDTVLRGIADILRREIRKEDVAARYGGEEFVVLLVDDDRDAALAAAERIRARLESLRFDNSHTQDGIAATISIGVATYPRDGRTGEALFHEADLAVYQAKRDGRNRVVAAGRHSRELAAEWAREHLVASTANVSAPQTVTGAVWKLINQATRTSINTNLIPQSLVSAGGAETAMSATQEPSRPAQARGPSPAVSAMITMIVVAALLSVAPELLSLTRQPIPWWPLLLFTGLTVLSSEMAVDTYGKGKTSIATVVKIAAAILLGNLGILCTALAAALVLKFKAHSPLHRMAFNFGTFVLAAQGAKHLFQLLIGPTINGQSLALLLPAAAAAGLAFYAINHLLLCSVRGLSDRQSPWTIWKADYLWLWPHYVVLGALALIVALNYQAFGALGAAAVMIPAAMMHLAIKQYMSRTAVHVGELRQMNQQLTDSYEATLQALTRALDTRDEETEEHSQRVKRYTQLIAERMHISGLELDDMVRGALLHDIGKIGVPDAILLKPGKLTTEEQEIMRRHPEIGYNMIVHIPFLAGAARIVLHHHESYNGAGYPSQLAGAQIPLGARIFAIADTFDAMTSDRPYRRALPVATAQAEILRCRGTQFDPTIVDAFLAIPISDLQAARSSNAPTPVVDMMSTEPRRFPTMPLAQH